jgi:hypothetical protein
MGGAGPDAHGSGAGRFREAGVSAGWPEIEAHGRYRPAAPAPRNPIVLAVSRGSRFSADEIAACLHDTKNGGVHVVLRSGFRWWFSYEDKQDEYELVEFVGEHMGRGLLP